MAQAVFSSLQQNTLREAALSAIRENILNGVLRPGEQLVQSEIAAQMNISRAPIREALRQLEEERLVDSIQYRGTFVSQVSRRDIIELYSLRGTLEAMAARLALARCNEADFSELSDALDRMSHAAQSGDYPALNAADLSFHTTICSLSGHSHLLRNWEMNANLIRRVLALRNQLNPLEVVVDMHKPILAAIRAKDVAAAQTAIEQHCLHSGEALAANWPEV